MLIKQFFAFIHSLIPCVSLGGKIIFFTLVYGKMMHSLGFVIMFRKVLFSCESDKQVFSEVIKFFLSQFLFPSPDFTVFCIYMWWKKKPNHNHIPWKSWKRWEHLKNHWHYRFPTSNSTEECNEKANSRLFPLTFHASKRVTGEKSYYNEFSKDKLYTAPQIKNGQNLVRGSGPTLKEKWLV